MVFTKNLNWLVERCQMSSQIYGWNRCSKKLTEVRTICTWTWSLARTRLNRPSPEAWNRRVFEVQKSQLSPTWRGGSPQQSREHRTSLPHVGKQDRKLASYLARKEKGLQILPKRICRFDRSNMFKHLHSPDISCLPSCERNAQSQQDQIGLNQRFDEVWSKSISEVAPSWGAGF